MALNLVLILIKRKSGRELMVMVRNTKNLESHHLAVAIDEMVGLSVRPYLDGEQMSGVQTIVITLNAVDYNRIKINDEEWFFEEGEINLDILRVKPDTNLGAEPHPDVKPENWTVTPHEPPPNEVAMTQYDIDRIGEL